MKRYIDADEAGRYLASKLSMFKSYPLDVVIDVLADYTEANHLKNAKEVVRGEWLGYVCSVCECSSECGSEYFCPNCGADMRKAVSDDIEQAEKSRQKAKTRA